MAGTTVTDDESAVALKLGFRGSARHLGAAVKLCWTAAPGALIGQALLSVTSGVGGWAAALLTKAIVDRLVAASPSRPAEGLLLLAIALGGTGALMAVQSSASRYLLGIMERALRTVVTARLYTAVNGLAGLARLEQPRFQDRVQLAQNAGRAGPSECVNGALTIGQSALTLTGYIASLTVIAPGMTAVVLVSVLPTVWVEVMLSRRRAAMVWRLGHAERREIFYSTLLSSLEAAKEIRLFRLGDYFGGRLLRELIHINREQHAMDRRTFVGQFLLTLLGSSIAAGGLVWAIGMAGTGRLTPGDITLFIAAVAGTQAALAVMVMQYGLVQQALLLFDHYRRVVSEPSDLPVPAIPAPCPPLRHGIELRDVWFRYSDDHPWILRGVTLRIAANESLALVGVNGAGKSTLVKLLCRFYDPVIGSIHWDGVDLRDMDPGQLRDRLGVVFQDFMCYDLTAAENIALGDVRGSHDAASIERAARLAGCHDAITALPRGYDTFLSRMFYNDADDPEAGAMLSGGQWQRVAVARALLRSRRDLLIMDEPSSGLDAEAEHELHSRLRELRHGQTSVLISHRLSTVRDADLIVVLEGGVIIEWGRHQELMAFGGRYATLFELQARGYQNINGDAPDGAPGSGPGDAPGDALPAIRIG